ncbi:MAG: hypothetical protein ACI4EX_11985 [Lachnospiraceae bacterium]
MGISRMNDYSSAFANFKLQQIPSVSVDELQKQGLQADRVNTPVSEPDNSVPAVQENRKQADIAVGDVSLTFNQKEDFGYIGKDSSIEKLDMEKAISDMKKDQVLQQYQYFVGRNERLTNQDNRDGLVIMKF